MHPREGMPLMQLGAGIHVVSPEGRLLIVQQEHGGVRHWGPLGGGLEYGETIEECALREAYEESGLRVRLLRLISVDQFWHAGQFQGVGFNFLAEPDPWPQDVRIPEFDGTTPFFDYRWVTREEAHAFFPDVDYEFWTQHWPSDVRETLIRRLDFEA